MLTFLKSAARLKTASTVVAASLLTATPPVLSQATESWQQAIKPAQQAIDLENYANAEQLFQRAITQGKSSKDEKLEAAARAGLAETLLWQGQIKQAGKEFSRSFKQVESALTDKPELADFYDAYSWLEQANGKHDLAKQYAEQALALRQKILPAGDEHIAESMEHLGTLAERQGNLPEAQKWYQQALDVRQVSGNDQSIARANIMEKLAIVDAGSGQTAAAQELFKQSMQIKAASGDLLERFAPKPAYQIAMYRFSPYAPYCTRSTDQVTYETITTPENVIVQAALTPADESQGKAKILLRVYNNSNQPLDFLPRPPLFVTLTPKIEIGSIMNLDQVADKVQKQGEHKASMIRFWQGDATTPVTSNIQTYGSSYMPGGWGYWQPGINYCGPQYSTVTTYVPDYQARARAEQKAQDAVAKADEAAAALRRQALGPTTIAAGQAVDGAVQFDVDKFATAILRIPIGNAIFEFPVKR